jgi:hypothetical protein
VRRFLTERLKPRIFFRCKGEVRIVNYSFSGREVTLDDAADGHQFGELAAIW